MELTHEERKETYRSSIKKGSRYRQSSDEIILSKKVSVVNGDLLIDQLRLETVNEGQDEDKILSTTAKNQPPSNKHAVKTGALKVIKTIMNQELKMQDDFQLASILKKLAPLEFACCFFTFITIISCLFAHDIYTFQPPTYSSEEKQEKVVDYLLVFSSVGVVFFTIACILRYLVILAYNKASHVYNQNGV